ncbi:MAG: ComEA family DNA-binding protein [Actinomycetota bacterium]|nr:ComEA family DNA-binding protein [Actinomycetota bacterium]
MTPSSSNLSVTAAGIGVLVVVAGAVWFGVGRAAPLPNSAHAGSTSTEVADSQSITVHVSGAVAQPGVVSVADDSRVADVVIAAGGATAGADLSRVNLAAQVRDGEHVVIPPMASTHPGGTLPVDRFDLNTADAVGFESLPGIGPVLAARIVAYREDNGMFESVEDLLDVPGIGESKLIGIRDALADL